MHQNANKQNTEKLVKDINEYKIIFYQKNIESLLEIVDYIENQCLFGFLEEFAKLFEVDKILALAEISLGQLDVIMPLVEDHLSLKGEDKRKVKSLIKKILAENNDKATEEIREYREDKSGKSNGSKDERVVPLTGVYLHYPLGLELDIDVIVLIKKPRLSVPFIYTPGSNVFNLAPMVRLWSWSVASKQRFIETELFNSSHNGNRSESANLISLLEKHPQYGYPCWAIHPISDIARVLNYLARGEKDPSKLLSKVKDESPCFRCCEDIAFPCYRRFGMGESDGKSTESGAKPREDKLIFIWLGDDNANILPADAGLKFVAIEHLCYWARFRNITSAKVAYIRREKGSVGSTEESAGEPYDQTLKDSFETIGKKVKGLVNHLDKTFAATKNLIPYALQVFLFSRCLENPEVDRWFGPGQSNQIVSANLQNIARLAGRGLAQLPMDDRTIQSVIWLMDEFLHGVLKLPARIDIRLHLLMAARGEPALHSLKRFYRDHFNHALEVASLGHLLLKTEFIDGEILLKGISEFTGREEQEVLQLWYLSALAHDVGYGIEILKAAEKHLSFFSNDASLQRLLSDIRSALNNLSSMVSTRIYGLTERDKPGEDHGIVGAVHLDSLLKRIAEDDKSVDPERYELAIQAIALHNLPKPISFRDNPLAFLLVLCDTIQEWNRPRLDFPTAPYKFLSWLSPAMDYAGEFNGPLRSLKTNLEILCGDDNNLKVYLADKSLKITLEYDEDINRDAGVFNLWLGAACNLQRMDFTGFPENVDIELEFVTPLFYTSDEYGLPADSPPADRSQMHRLRNAARDTHMAFLDRFFPVEPLSPHSNKVSNGYVTHWFDSNNDHLILHLRKLARVKPITRGMDVFRDSLQKWREYDRDRSFPGDYAAPARPE